MISDDQLLELVESIWTTMLSLSISRVGDEALMGSPPELTAKISISGSSQAMVVLSATEQLARHATAIMLATPEESLSQADLQDALAELCNIVGGGVKSILPGPSSLSLPKVSAGPPPAAADPSMHLAAHVCFACDGQPADVRVLISPNARQS